MKQKAEQVMRANKECMADHYCTLRNGRVCIPVKKEYKLKISGSVIDKSSTGSTLFMEPASVAKYYEELQILRISEENEVYRILYTLSSMVAGASPVMHEDLSMIEKLDLILSKGKLSIDMDATEPAVNTARSILLSDARHPLMDRKIAVPLQFDIGEKVRGIIIDSFGKLSSLYRYADIAYIGGGFGAGIHNLNEAAVYGIPVIFGPNHSKFKEANDLIERGGGFSITSIADFYESVDALTASKSTLSQAGEAAGQYIRDNLGATDRIYSEIFSCPRAH